mgnify:CR=1 FL=1
MEAYRALRAAGAIAPLVLVGLGFKDAGTVEDAPQGSDWSDVSGAYDRAPRRQGIGFALAQAFLDEGARHVVVADLAQDRLDGLTVDGGDWWFNLRASNTEPLLRLNLEAATPSDVERRVAEVRAHFG